VTFEDDAGAYDQQDAAGFIKLNALRLAFWRSGIVKVVCGHGPRERDNPFGLATNR
jgi:hypothetical protein